MARAWFLTQRYPYRPIWSNNRNWWHGDCFLVNTSNPISATFETIEQSMKSWVLNQLVQRPWTPASGNTTLWCLHLHGEPKRQVTWSSVLLTDIFASGVIRSCFTCARSGSTKVIQNEHCHFDHFVLIPIFYIGNNPPTTKNRQTEKHLQYLTILCKTWFLSQLSPLLHSSHLFTTSEIS